MPPPIGPLAIALRHAGRRPVHLLALAMILLLAAGVGLLFV